MSDAINYQLRSTMSVLNEAGFTNPQPLCNTLQGGVWKAQLASSAVVIKRTSRSRHDNGIAVVNNKTYTVEEDILLERSILKYVTEHAQCPESIVKFYDFFQTNEDYYLVMEDGGHSLFEFVVKAHKLIQTGQLDIAEWRKLVRVIYRQMLQAINFLHALNITHNDISLENWLINDLSVEIEMDSANSRPKVHFLLNEVQIKLCDFGLADLHTKPSCLSNKYCGKTQYKSPEVTHKSRGYSAKANDTWSLGITLFMMSFGCPPWTQSNMSNDTMKVVMKGQLSLVLEAWNLEQYADKQLIHLFHCIFRLEHQRISLNDIAKHPAIKA